MNTFVTITIDQRFIYEKVSYYSVTYEDDPITSEGEKLSEADKFFERLEQEADEDDILNFIAILEDIGNFRGAKERYFRPENNFNALPPKRQSLSEFELEDNWRLYCLRLSDSVVILFNGGLKTTYKAQDCPNVAPFFRQASTLTRKIDELIQEGAIKIEHKKLDFDTDLEIML